MEILLLRQRENEKNNDTHVIETQQLEEMRWKTSKEDYGSNDKRDQDENNGAQN